MKIDHIGYIVNSLEKAVEEFVLLGFEKESKVYFDEEKEIKLCFLKNNGYRIEIVEPINEESFLCSYLCKSGPSPYHICYKVREVDRYIKLLRKRKYIPIKKYINNNGMITQRIFFLYNKNLGLIELIETI